MGIFGAQSIEAKGGLEPHLESLGASYSLFIELVDLGMKNAPIAAAMSADRRKRLPNKPDFKSSTIKKWRGMLK